MNTREEYKKSKYNLLKIYMHINIHINPEKNMQRRGVEVLCPTINVQGLTFSACYYAY